ncbi:MAG: 4-(cytidine 5'-diphospho)-2-C-methyl-D-erythritol kinase [Alphaproteobacteria bacterium]|nr:4-(cytidine 5'-diphospho)-2-C-methyl-D-erythritol kinase [Alphaproteobacteria bacterium]
MSDGPASGAGLTEPAPAKVNLYLHVVGKRADGYHLLDSLVGFVAVADRLHLEPGSAAPGLTVSGPFAAAVPDDDGNLAWRAVARLAAHAGRPADIAVHLDKQLPVAAGLGGGSADAAAVLRALVRLWDFDPGDPELAAIAEALGADVPVCLAGGSRFVGGIGEDLAPGPPLAGLAVVLANPGVPLATRDVFRARTGAFSSPGRFAADPAAGPQDLIERLAALRNDLTAPAVTLCPPIGDVLAALAAAPGCRLARMSGSGPSCFGLFADAAAAARAAEGLAAAEPGWWVRAGHFL